MTEAVIIYQSIDLLRKSMDWFLYDNGLRHERVKMFRPDWSPKSVMVSVSDEQASAVMSHIPLVIPVDAHLTRKSFIILIVFE